MADLVARARASGVGSVEMVAWRDLDDPEAGGSELHSHRIASMWAEAGLEVTFRTSAVPGETARVERSGYTALRRHGRYGVFPGVAFESLRERGGPDALVEVWNGMPFFSPLWFRGPKLIFLHHVHAEMWGMALPPVLAAVGRAVESTLAPLVYRRSSVVTLSESSRDEIVSMLGLPADHVSVVTPGVDPAFAPGGARSPVPLVLAVGRLVPVKRFDMLMEALARVRADQPALHAIVVGEGYERDRLETLRHRLGAETWLSLPGHVSGDVLLDLYRRAWLVASTSLREGWGMTLTEAGACGTPGIASRIAGHRDAVVDGVTGILVDGVDDLADAVAKLLADDALRRDMGRAARAHAQRFSWESTASWTLQGLVDEAEKDRRKRKRGRAQGS